MAKKQETTVTGGAPFSFMAKLYEGTKVLKAAPMTRGEYNEYRGWDAPEGEDQTVAGYMVEYAPIADEPPNVVGHDGYVSWSPAVVFEATYREIPTDWRERVQAEQDDLLNKLAALGAFFGTTTYADLGGPARELLNMQKDYMQGYADILARRLALAPPDPTTVAADDWRKDLDPDKPGFE